MFRLQYAQHECQFCRCLGRRLETDTSNCTLLVLKLQSFDSQCGRCISKQNLRTQLVFSPYQTKMFRECDVVVGPFLQRPHCRSCHFFNAPVSADFLMGSIHTELCWSVAFLATTEVGLSLRSRSVFHSRLNNSYHDILDFKVTIYMRLQFSQSFSY